jgi:hypothetical protein
MDMQAIAKIPNNTPSAFIYNTLGWQHFEKNRSSSTLDKLKAVAMTIFSILTAGAPILFLKLAQIQYLKGEAKGDKRIEQISKMQDRDAKIEKSINYLEQFLQNQHIDLASKTFHLVSLELENNPRKEAILGKCADLFRKYNQTELYNKTSSLSSCALFAELTEFEVPKTSNLLNSSI